MKIKILVLVLIMLMSCKNTRDESSLEKKNENLNEEVTKKELSKLKFIDFTLDVRTEKVVENWKAYYELQDMTINIKKGDLSFFKNNKEGIKTLFKDLLKNIPAEVNNDATLARIVALETKLYKLESLSNLSTTSKEELGKGIQEFLESFSNLNFQMNKKIEKDHQIIEKP